MAFTIAPAPYASSKGVKQSFRTDFPPEYAEFPERNLGLQVLQTDDPDVIALITLFRDVYVRHANDLSIDIGNDQASFREALYTLRRTVNDVIIPAEKGCRHNAGCQDGCLAVHRHQHQTLSRAELIALKGSKAEVAKKKLFGEADDYYAANYEMSE